MVESQKEEIKIMRKDGQSYSRIALALGISENTVKSYCRRNKLGINKRIKIKIEKEICTTCKHCGKSLIQGTKGQAKKFCSENCRRLWWKANESEYDKKAYYSLICVGCGKKFQSYGNKNRKFCSHSCYINYRFRKEGI